MVAAAATPYDSPPQPDQAERRFVLHGVPWWTYVALRDALDDQGGLKMTYLEGTLELMSSSMLHEEAKKIIARLVEVWAMERDVDLAWACPRCGYGGPTPAPLPCIVS